MRALKQTTDHYTRIKPQQFFFNFVVWIFLSVFLWQADEALFKEEIKIWSASFFAVALVTIGSFLIFWVRSSYILYKEISSQKIKYQNIIDKIYNKEDLYKKISNLYFEGKGIYYSEDLSDLPWNTDEELLDKWMGKMEEWRVKTDKFLEENTNIHILHKFRDGSNRGGCFQGKISSMMDKTHLFQFYTNKIDVLDEIISFQDSYWRSDIGNFDSGNAK